MVVPAPAAGLDEEEARARLARDGPNELERTRRRGPWRLILEVLREPMLLLLLIGGAIYLALGDAREALMLLAFACFSVGVTIVQEARSERALAALRSMASPRALVIRAGTKRRIAARDLVAGDLVLLSEGDRVPADGWLVEEDGLTLDESLLTGESVPVTKTVGDEIGAAVPPRPGGDGLPLVFSGTLVVRGSGLARIAATGPHSEIGRIGRSLALLEAEPPRLYRETRRLVILFAIGAAAATALAVLLYGLLRGSWLEAALAGIALGMSLLPEEFAVVLTIFLAMGAMRMTRVRVLARRAAAIETLGAASILCTDKTGTLTENRMRVAELCLPDGRINATSGTVMLPEAFDGLAELGALASAAEPFDPMEIAFHELDRTQRAAGAAVRRDAGWDLRRHYPLDPSLLAVSRVWDTGGGQADHVIASKGAPEAIAELCGLDDAARAELKRLTDAMAGRGLRVLGIAEARWHGDQLPGTHRAFAFELAGLVGLEDPLRASVPEAVRQCRSAGIRVVMITGDYPETARAIAAQAGIETSEVVTGQMLEQIDDAELLQRVGTIGIFARILPEQKLRIVEALKARGETVAMTGDGVNDAPSLKAADIGVAMGGRGTDVAREASAIVLLDDDFGSIVAAVRMGRRIYDNLAKAMGFIVAVHVPIAGLALMPLLFGMPILLGPIHMALLEMIIDPVSSLAFEAEREEDDVMHRRPRSTRAQLLGPALIGRSIVQGLVALLVVGVVLFVFSRGAPDPVELRSTVFVALVAAVLSLVLVNRSFSASLVSALRRPNPALAAVVLMVVLMFLLAELVPAFGGLFGFVALDPVRIIAALAAGVLVLLLLEGLKLACAAGTKAGPERLNS